MGNPQGGSQKAKVKSQKADTIGFWLILDGCAIDSVLY